MGSRGKNRTGKKKNLQKSSSSGVALAPAVRTDEAPELELLSNKPTPRPGERIEDVAIFASLARQQLSEELRTEAASVAEALDKIHRGALEQALADVKGIPVNSPFADWKLSFADTWHFAIGILLRRNAIGSVWTPNVVLAESLRPC